jgi:hypothetical protein
MSAPVLRTGIAAHLGLKYTVLRQAADGSMVEAGPDFLFRADTVRVRFEPNDNGYLTVAEAGASGPLRQIAAARVERGRPFEALLPAASGAGTRSLVVSFSREPSPAGLGGGQPADTAAPARTDQQVETGPAQRTTYVVARDAAPAAQRVTFTITLNYR